MRRKPIRPTMKVNSVAPTATAPNWWAWGRWPMTVLSTRATSGTEMLDRIIGAARAQTLWWVGRCCQSVVSEVIGCPGESWGCCAALSRHKAAPTGIV
ncbi:hypothetical protein D3C79_797130 [compost metagenome]